MLTVTQFPYLRASTKLSASLTIMVLLASPAAAQSKELSDLAKARDANGNGVIEKSEAGGPLAANFDTIDTDKNGTLDGAEIRAFFQGGPAPASTSSAQIGDDSTELSPQAKARDANGNGTIEKSEAGGPIAANSTPSTRTRAVRWTAPKFVLSFRADPLAVHAEARRRPRSLSMM